MNPVKVLILEDDLDDVTIVTRMLSRSPYAPVDIKNTDSREGFCGLLQTFEPDIILADYRLPQFSGIEALQATLEYNAKIPFIFVTGSIGEESTAAAILSGASGFVLKSKLDKLNEVVTECLEKSHKGAVDERINVVMTISLRIEEQIKANQAILDRLPPL